MNRPISWVKIILFFPMIVAIVCAAGIVLCRLMHRVPHEREMLIAGLIGLASAELAMIPLYIVRDRSADYVVPGALISTVIQMGVAATGAMMVMQWMHPPKAFFYWICVFYWTTLAGVCRVLSRAVKSAPIPAVGPTNSAGPANLLTQPSES